MRSLSLVLAVATAFASVAACREVPDGGAVDAPGGAGDGPSGIGCDPREPRAVSPEAFVAPTGVQARITGLIDGAQTSLDVQMYLFTVTAIADRIIAAHQRGVAVRVILDDHNANPNVRTRLTSAGVPVREAPSLYSFSHAKYFIVDRTAAVVMSMNFNVDAMSRERNYGFIDRDPEDVADVAAIFEMDWAAGGGEPPKPADLACTRLVVSPNNARQRILELVNSAKTKLDIAAMYISEMTVRTAIIQAASRGVAVRVILQSSTDESGGIAALRAANIPVHDADNAAFFLHAKLMIADGVAFVGSENFSSTSLTRNREVGALIFEPAQVSTIQQQFDRDYADTPAVP
ncbi:MAG: phosphatidylserine/phosphatidylglycerophosphate/cardiolipin synthase family protein [Deltaproteobacteria bacterium]|nr:phosphatidylserine/phosphatidylglycerophosphate/cardiolipin synthase family protein [Deltaproteobacteria bacterium]MCW5808667.1 phosphatidylserine/phosphatidylglycerophosphate/cardiolipin synthase family protein [Deltaproteobacteria bacterium]